MRLEDSKLATGPQRREIIHLSAPADVCMSEWWFDLVSPQHFWMIRRFQVLEKLAAAQLKPGLRYAEIGCGTGVLQRQLERRYGIEVDGFDLGLGALQASQAQAGKLYYYNVFDRNPEFSEHYDVIFLFDVLEHVTAEDDFLQSCLFHLKRGGALILNVPARMELYSNYDKAVGHVRRYRLKDFRRLVRANHLELRNTTYWGLPFYLLLAVRKRLLRHRTDEADIIQRGMKPPSNFSNRVFGLLARLEFIPQRILGTSIMTVLHKP